MARITSKTLILTLLFLLVGGIFSVEILAKRKKRPKYVGSEFCAECHLKAFKSWEKTKLATSLLVLGPRKKVQKKKELGLDPLKNYTTDAECMKCHTTGFKKKKDGTFKFSEYGIGCEECHGPGSVYSEIMRKKGRDYERKELTEAGMILYFKKGCLTCHRSQSPLVEKDSVFIHKEKYKDVHTPVKLKYHEKVERFPDEKE